MDRVVEGADLDDAFDKPPQRGGQRGRTDVPVARVGDHDHVTSQPLVVLGEQRLERRRAGLLLALDEDGHPDGKVVSERADGGQVRGDACLVVGGAPREQPSVAFGRLERRRDPRSRGAFGLDVVVGVEQDRRAPSGAGR